MGDQSLPTDVYPVGNAIFGVSFEALNESPRETEHLEQRKCSTKELSKERQQPHIIYITFNDDNVPGNNNVNSSQHSFLNITLSF